VICLVSYRGTLPLSSNIVERVEHHNGKQHCGFALKYGKLPVGVIKAGSIEEQAATQSHSMIRSSNDVPLVEM
jgi:hypothetical protein